MTGYRISPRLPVLFSPLLVCSYLTLTFFAFDKKG